MPTVHNPHRWTDGIKPTKAAGKYNDLGILRTCQNKNCKRAVVDWSKGMIHLPNEVIAEKYNRLNWQVSRDFKVCLCPRCTPLGQRQEKRAVGRPSYQSRSNHLEDLGEMVAAANGGAEVDFNDTTPIKVVAPVIAAGTSNGTIEHVGETRVVKVEQQPAPVLVPEVPPKLLHNAVPPVPPKRIIAPAPVRANGAAPAVEPSTAQREALQTALQLLFQEYDTKRGAYREGWNDQRIATVSGLSASAVKTERERLFGAMKEDPAVAALLARLDKLQERLQNDNRDLAELRDMHAAVTTELTTELTKLRLEVTAALRR